MAKETLELYRQKARGLAIAISTAKYKSLEKGGLPERDKKSLDQLDEELKKLAARLGLNGEKKRTIDKESGLPHFE